MGSVLGIGAVAELLNLRPAGHKARAHLRNPLTSWQKSGYSPAKQKKQRRSGRQKTFHPGNPAEENTGIATGAA
tara:strand:+ start:264 stop:485 length:222 start_codon:yes stop_codon:yes gene_type:complete